MVIRNERIFVMMTIYYEHILTNTFVCLCMCEKIADAYGSKKEKINNKQQLPL